ncbi:hypothetical protein GPECTOR_75g746 [Gonium pectorale]|uniref:Uncharacterized protein n=1 Tax=Gonium pectorale TaxID=33097 RepID=A0A150G2C4_GONPE|nr:hypothetical protein GPECTOR_75g746 [Gonium pectorale]|eukprot:KXZ44022.1 hypothetical protein GPECTOR_75g746 [Gonium pectorale]
MSTLRATVAMQARLQTRPSGAPCRAGRRPAVVSVAAASRQAAADGARGDGDRASSRVAAVLGAMAASATLLLASNGPVSAAELPTRPVAELSELPAWLASKLPAPAAISLGGAFDNLKTAAKDAASRAAENASNAAAAANAANEEAGLASATKPTEVQPTSDLLSSVAKPSPAPGKGPIAKAAKREAKSEAAEPELRASAAAAGQPQATPEKGV